MTVIAKDLIVSTFYKRRIRCENLGNLKSYILLFWLRWQLMYQLKDYMNIISLALIVKI